MLLRFFFLFILLIQKSFLFSCTLSRKKLSETGLRINNRIVVCLSYEIAMYLQPGELHRRLPPILSYKSTRPALVFFVNCIYFLIHFRGPHNLKKKKKFDLFMFWRRVEK